MRGTIRSMTVYWNKCHSVVFVFLNSVYSFITVFLGARNDVSQKYSHDFAATVNS